MRRRRLLAALSLLPALAGCAGRTAPSPTHTATAEPTVPNPTATPITGAEPLPEPPESPSAESALAFVREYERVAARNQVVEHGGGEVRDPEIGEPVAAVAATVDAGFYLFGACRAAGEYGDGRGYRVNRHEVPHFVGRAGRHEVAPWSAVVCESADRAFEAEDPGENAADPDERFGAELHLFRFDGADRDVRVLVDYLDADGPPQAVYSTTVAASDDAPDPAYEYVLGNLAVRRGTYRVSVDVAGAAAADPDATATWTLSDPEAPAWTGLSVFVGDDGRPAIGLPETENDLLVPGPSLCAVHQQNG